MEVDFGICGEGLDPELLLLSESVSETITA